MNIELSPKATEIVTCTRLLLAAGGYNSFSYADISESVHISKASIHHHFPSKAELVQTVVRLYREEARVGMTTLDQQIPDPLAQLEAYTGYWAACIRDGTSSLCIGAMLAAELPAIPSAVADEVRGHFSDLAAWLASVLAKGASQRIFVLQANPEAEAMAFMATVHGAMLSARAYGDPEVFATIVQPLMRRLTSQPTSR
jgi:TetR/AcrR family transcriptional repressor of nem operon